MSGWLFLPKNGGASVGFFAPSGAIAGAMAWREAVFVPSLQDGFDLVHHLNGGNEAQLKLVSAALEKIAAALDAEPGFAAQLAEQINAINGSIEARAVAAVNDANRRGEPS